MAGKRMVISVEIDPGQRLGEAVVKQLTGGDDVRARYLFQESFEFTPTFKVWFPFMKIRGTRWLIGWPIQTIRSLPGH